MKKNKHSPFQQLKAYLTGALALFIVIFILYIQRGESQLDQVYAQDEIRVVIRDTPSNYYAQGDEDQIDGFETKLAELYADYLNVNLNLVVEENVKDVIQALYENKADLAAAGLTAGVERSPPIRYSDIYQVIQEWVVYFSDTRKPSKISDLSRKKTVVSAQSSHATALEQLQKGNPQIKFTIDDEHDTFQLMEQVTQDKIDYTIVDSHELEQFRRFHPELRVGFEFRSDQGLAFAFKPMTYYTGLYDIIENLKSYGFAVDTLTQLQHSLPYDNSLIKSSNKFLKKIRNSGDLEYWLDVYYGHILDFDYADTTKFAERKAKLLPQYQAMFQDAAKDDLDWKLLAAIGYQESHWEKNAVSPTGVRGLMMLTTNTARSVSVKNREDPKQSIYGGARYFRRMHDLLPRSIEEPDRTWIALAAYNIGIAHIIDVRSWVKAAGKNPNQWHEIKEMLPKKSQASFYRKSKYGFARGKQAVEYVENIRRYHDLLKYEEAKDEPSLRGAQ